MKKILMAYDGSPCAEAAIEDLTRAGLPDGMEALVLSIANVWVPPDSGQLEPAFPATTPKAVIKARTQALEAVEASRALAQKAGARLQILFPKWKVESSALGDSPAWGVLKEAGQWKANLIVLGSHGRPTLEQIFLGSVSQKVAAEAHCSVRIGRNRRGSRDGPLKIMVAVDGSADSKAAVQAVMARAWPPSTEFDLVAVIDPRMETAMAWPDVYPDQWVQPPDKQAREWVCRMVEHFARELYDAGRTAETYILEGDPKQVLARQAEHCGTDCLFLGARGLQHGNRLFLGSTASGVAARAHCSVEIVRPG